MLLFIVVIASMYVGSMAVLKFLYFNISIQDKRKENLSQITPVPNCPTLPYSVVGGEEMVYEQVRSQNST
jgi:hypothetical protein